jgi:cellulose synthase/poly-beta-1,6-N-acetylglucosamine synthase-like glycosyltransferase
MLQDYPKEWFDVVVIADSFKPETIEKLRSLPVRVIEVSFESSTKAKALNAAMAALPDNYYDIALVLDADNVMDLNFLTRINRAFVPGVTAVQGHRVAKNTNTSMAILDAISEEITNHIFRKGHRVLGLSSGLIGSGMAFDYPYYKQIMASAKAIGGFDKELELKMLSQRKVIEYLEDVYVYDEKVQDTGVFIKQRRRWLSAQLHYAGYFPDALKSFFVNGNIDFLDKACQMLLPPRIILLGVLFIFSVITGFINPLPITGIWLFLFLCSLLSFALSVPGKFYNSKTFKALLMLPAGFFLMTFSLLTTSGANKKFIHTQHTHVHTDPNKKEG